MSFELGMTRLSRLLFWRGLVLVLLGASAVFWPQQMMVLAIFTVGAIAVALGAFELAIALSMRGRSTWWPLVALHGALFLAFGLITFGAPGLGFDLAMLLLSLWLLLYAGMAFTTGLFVWETRAVRWALVAWGLVNLTVATLVIMNPGVTLIVVFVSGALYAVLLGAWQMTAGVWCRRTARLLSVDAQHRRAANGPVAPQRGERVVRVL